MTQSAEAMNLLNEASRRYPEAISFAAGRPPDAWLQASCVPRWLDCFVEHISSAGARAKDDVWNSLGQYSDTNGVVLEFVARQIELDEGISVDPRACMLTNGAQEAIAIALLGLVRPDRCVVATDPTYVGLTGAANSLGVPVVTVPDSAEMIVSLEALLRERANGSGPRVGAFYSIPDFSNPLFRVMSARERQRLLELAEAYDFYIIEDSAYRKFRYTGEAISAIKSFDKSGRVVYVQSYAKTFLPGIRTAVLVADRRLVDGRYLAEHLSSLKSYISVASSPITQAILAGFLIEQACSLEAWVSTRRAWCKANRDAMLEALSRHFGERDEVHWDEPEGGYFLAVSLVSDFGHVEFTHCAQQAGVIVVPMSMFSSTRRFARTIRLAFSNVRPSEIEEGVARLAGFLLR